MSDVPRSVSDLKRALEDGRCFVAELQTGRIYLEFVETVGWVRTDTDRNGGDPFTTSTSHDELRTVLRFGDLQEVEEPEIPIPDGGESDR